MGDVAAEYLKTVKARFAEAKKTADRAMAQMTDEQLFWAPGAESNSIAVIVKHMAGNMLSRWTDFFTTDGEKADRNRDGEFEADAATREALLARWEQGWQVFFGALESIGEEDLLRTITIRQEPHSVIQAIERQMYHYSYHVGQIVYLAKQMVDADWQTLTIPRKR
ncbi:MAG TPA: DinB family protein [Symbiobacteriaceae bacterium]|nr:DinB family protein [Symbiobacteriaceae bacterium]